MITTYTPSRCRYAIGRLKQHVYLISAASCTIHIDIDSAWVENLTETPLFIKGAVTLNESTSYDDRFKFTKSVSLTVQNYVNLSYLQGKYYVILEDEGGNYWFVNPDFPCLVTYTYTLGDDVSETQFTFNSLSNFPLLRFTCSMTDVRECEQYIINGLKRLRLTEAKNVSYDQSTSTVYLYHGKEFYDVEFLDGTLSITEEFDGNQVNTSIQFAIQLDDYKPSWQYNLLEYQDNKYAAIITTNGADGEFISGFEFGLVPSYSIVGGDSQDDIITITLQGASSYGSLPSGGDSEHSVAMSRWAVVEKEPEYTWKLTDEWKCVGFEYRWVNLDPSVDYYCSGETKYYKEVHQISYDSGETWSNLDEYRMGDVASCYSTDCDWTGNLTFRWVTVSDEYVCNGFHKYTVKKQQASPDGGETWYDITGSTQIDKDGLVEKYSSYCCQKRTVTANTCDELFRNINASIEEASLDGEEWIETGHYTANTVTSGYSQSCLADANVKFFGLPVSGATGSSVFDYRLYDQEGSFYNGARFANSNYIIIGCDRDTGYTDNGNIEELYIESCAGTPSFSGNSQSTLKKIHIASGVTGTFGGPIYWSDYYGALSGYTALTEVDGFGNSQINAINGYAFKGDTSLREVTIPETCSNIMTGAFSGCTSLSSLTINSIYLNKLPGQSVAYQQYGQFEDCTSLTSVTFSENFHGLVYDWMFAGCPLQQVTFYTVIPPTLGRDALSGSYPVYVPASAVEDYKDAWWNDIDATRIRPIP